MRASDDVGSTIDRSCRQLLLEVLMRTLDVTRSLLAAVVVAVLTPPLASAQTILPIPSRVALYPWGIFAPQGSGVTAKVAAASGSILLQSSTTATAGAAPLTWVNFS